MLMARSYGDGLYGDCLYGGADIVPSGLGGHVVFPGTSGNRLTVPDEAPLDILGDITCVANAAADNWATGAFQGIAVKRTNATDNAYRFFVNTTGGLTVIASPDGTDGAQRILASTAAVPAADGEMIWLAWVLDVNNDAAGVDAFFWTSADGQTWDPLGLPVTQAVATSIFASTADLHIGGNLANQNFAGDLRHLSIRDGRGLGGLPGGTEVFLFDGPVDLDGIDPASTEFEASTGQTITVNRSGEPSTELVPPGIECVTSVELVPCPQLVAVASGPADSLANTVPCPPGGDC